MTGFDIIEKALVVIGAKKANILFVTHDYVMFYMGNPPESNQMEDELNNMGVYYIGKFECYGIDNEVLCEVSKIN